MKESIGKAPSRDKAAESCSRPICPFLDQKCIVRVLDARVVLGSIRSDVAGARECLVERKDLEKD